MKSVFQKAFLVCALAACATQSVWAEEEKEYAGAPDPKSYGYTVLAVGLATPLTLPWGWDWDIFGLDVNLLYSDCCKMYGIEVGGLANCARNEMKGIQVALGCNFANRSAMGAMVSCANICNRGIYGLSVDAVGINRSFGGISVDVLGSMTDSSFYGFDVAGLASAVREDMWGWQIALGANFARRAHGLQTALLFNMTDELHGAQIGLVNYAATCSAGFQIGLVNMIMDNQLPFLPIFNCYF